jgi:hypothetical protein
VAPSEATLQGSRGQSFRFRDVPPVGARRRTTSAVGSCDGAGAAEAPKTNLATSGRGRAGDGSAVHGPTGIPPDLRPLDSLLVWNGPRGRARGLSGCTCTSSRIRAAKRSSERKPAPMYVDVTRDFFLSLHCPAPRTTLGSVPRAHAPSLGRKAADFHPADEWPGLTWCGCGGRRIAASMISYTEPRAPTGCSVRRRHQKVPSRGGDRASKPAMPGRGRRTATGNSRL